MEIKEVYDTIREKCGEQLNDIEQAVMLYQVEQFREELILSMKVGPQNWITAICEKYKTTVFDLNTDSRKREVVLPRQIIMWGLSERIVENELSLTAIGGFFKRDHATVLHSKRTINNKIETDIQFREEIMMLLNEFEWHTEWRPASKTFHKWRAQAQVA